MSNKWNKQTQKMDIKEGYNFGIVSKTYHFLGSDANTDQGRLKLFDSSKVDANNVNILFQFELAKSWETNNEVGVIIRQATGHILNLNKDLSKTACKEQHITVE